METMCPRCKSPTTTQELAAYRRCEACYVGREQKDRYMPHPGEGTWPFPTSDNLREVSNNVTYRGDTGRIVRKDY